MEEAAVAAEAAAAAEAAEAEAAAQRAADEAAAEAARMEAAAKARKAAEDRAHAAKLNASLAVRMASSKPRTNAQNLHTAAALQMSDSAAFDAFLQWEDEVQKAAKALLGNAPKFGKKARSSTGSAGEGSLFTLLAMEEQTRNQSFVNALQTQQLPRPIQGKALRCACHAQAPWNSLHCQP